MPKLPFRSGLVKLACAIALVATPSVVQADGFTQANLVSDVPGLASTLDSNLNNPWGVSFAPASPFWVSDQGTGLSTLYTGAGSIVPLVVTIPAGNPTGQVFNGGSGFALGNGQPARFIFDTLGGTIAGWNGGTSAVQMASAPGAVFTGLALATRGGSPYLYAADSTGQIRVFNSSWKNVTSTTFAGKFVDPHPAAGFVPFNIQKVGSDLYATYARLTPMGTGLPGGYIDVFDTSGNFMKRFATGGSLFAPWGITLAPNAFGSFSKDLLVGNFGNGEILAFNPSTGAFLGTLDGTNGKPLVNSFLWSLETRTGGTGVNTDAVYFTAGINNQKDGLFGEITIPEPPTILQLALGLIVLMSFGLHRLASGAMSPRT
jgi:uncharacterized protein (TIGR03118 family)